MFKRYVFAALLACSAGIAGQVRAESGMDIAVGKGLHLKQIDGSWVQLEHFTPRTKQTDVCVASSRDQALVLRIAASDMQIRTYDPKWHLTPNIKNTADIRLGNGYRAQFKLNYLDKRGFVTPVSFEQISTLLKALETGKPGTITFSNKNLRHSRHVKKINPAKADRVFAAFRNCVRTHHFAPLEAPLPLKKHEKTSEEPIVFPEPMKK